MLAGANSMFELSVQSSLTSCGLKWSLNLLTNVSILCTGRRLFTNEPKLMEGRRKSIIYREYQNAVNSQLTADAGHLSRCVRRQFLNINKLQPNSKFIQGTRTLEHILSKWSCCLHSCIRNPHPDWQSIDLHDETWSQFNLKQLSQWGWKFIFTASNEYEKVPVTMICFEYFLSLNSAYSMQLTFSIEIDSFHIFSSLYLLSF